MRRLAAHCLLALGAAGSAAAAPAMIPLTLPSGKQLSVELMVSNQERALGLMYRPSLPQDRGLLFLFEGLGFHAIWMKNCRFPIDIVWLDERRRVVHVAVDVPPCTKDPCPSYQPLQKAAYVLEINAGVVAREGIEVGSRLSFELPR